MLQSLIYLRSTRTALRNHCASLSSKPSRKNHWVLNLSSLELWSNKFLRYQFIDTYVYSPSISQHQEVGGRNKSPPIKGQDSNDGRVVKDAKSHTFQGYKTDKTPCVKWASERARRGSTKIRVSLLRIPHTRRETAQHPEHEGRGIIDSVTTQPIIPATGLDPTTTSSLVRAGQCPLVG